MPLAASRPAEALAAAREVLARRPSPEEAAVAHQTMGFLLRDFGDADASIAELRTALRLARRSGIADLQADVRASLAVALVFAGHTAAGLAAFERAAAQARGLMKARVLHRRGIALWTLGRYPAALADLHRAVNELREADDPIWTARALTARGLVHLAQGSTARADSDFVEAGNWFAVTSQDLESIYTVHNRAKVACRAGNLPMALCLLDQAAQRYRSLNVPMPELSIDRCGVLLTAGLPGEALAEAETAIAELERFGGQATQRAELLLIAATTALADHEPLTAISRAQAARRLFRSQHRALWQAHAHLVLLQAQHATGTASAQLLRSADRAAMELGKLGSPEAIHAHLLAGRVARELGHPRGAATRLAAAARGRRHGPALARAAGWLAEALRAELVADPWRVLDACRRGLEVLDAHRLTLGASELRAQATAHGSELAMLAQRHAMRARHPRLLLTWSERYRATAMTVPAVHPSADADADLATHLAAVREVTSRLGQARSQGGPTSALEREQRRLERAVRAKVRQIPAFPGAAPSRVDIAALLDLLGPAQLVEIVDVDGTVHVLVCGKGKVRHIVAGRVQEAARAAEFARFALRRLARLRPGADTGSALSLLAVTGARLEEALLGEAVRQLGDGPIVIVPPGRLHAIPWPLLPALRDRAISVAPSATVWMRAHACTPPSRRNVVLIRGPGLVSRGAEISGVALIYPDVNVLAEGKATAEQVLHALDGAWMAHIAAHGTFRGDSPMFSSLRMDDGPLTVYDFEQLHHAPHRLILASCESAALAPAGADELLGLAASLMPLGTAGIIASIVPVDDITAVPVMLSLHRHLHGGLSFAEALCRVRGELTSDPIQRATTLSLLALGAG